MKQGAFLKSHELTWNMRDRVWELTGKVEDPDGKEIRFYFPLSNLPRKMCIRLIKENQQLKKLLNQCKYELRDRYTDVGWEDWSLLTKIDNAIGEK